MKSTQAQKLAASFEDVGMIVNDEDDGSVVGPVGGHLIIISLAGATAGR